MILYVFLIACMGVCVLVLVTHIFVYFYMRQLYKRYPDRAELLRVMRELDLPDSFMYEMLQYKDKRDVKAKKYG